MTNPNVTPFITFKTYILFSTLVRQIFVAYKDREQRTWQEGSELLQSLSKIPICDHDHRYDEMA